MRDDGDEMVPPIAEIVAVFGFFARVCWILEDGLQFHLRAQFFRSQGVLAVVLLVHTVDLESAEDWFGWWRGSDPQEEFAWFRGWWGTTPCVGVLGGAEGDV